MGTSTSVNFSKGNQVNSDFYMMFYLTSFCINRILRFLLVTTLLVVGFILNSEAQVSILTQPSNSVNCLPKTSTSYPLKVIYGKGSCGNITNSNTTVLWQFSANNSTWTNVNNLPLCYSYAKANSDLSLIVLDNFSLLTNAFGISTTDLSF